MLCEVVIVCCCGVLYTLLELTNVKASADVFGTGGTNFGVLLLAAIVFLLSSSASLTFSCIVLLLTGGRFAAGAAGGLFDVFVWAAVVGVLELPCPTCFPGCFCWAAVEGVAGLPCPVFLGGCCLFNSKHVSANKFSG